MIDTAQLRKLSPQDGDILVLPADAPMEHVNALLDALELVASGQNVMVMIGDIKHVTVEQMNAAGWYRA